jgi:FAD/FMN-containing dehydrogenase
MVYSRAGTYTRKLQELKRELDPHNILNPGQLCF